MKILFVAVFSPTSTNNSQSRGFQRAGGEVIEYNYRERGSVLGAEARDKDIIKTCVYNYIDFVVFSKCNGVHYSTIDKCNQWAKTVMWYMDPMSNFNEELIEKIKRCTHTFCALTEPYIEAHKYSENVHFLHEGFDLDTDTPVEMHYKHDISFIGGLRGIRGVYQRKYGFYNYTNAYGKDHPIAVAESKINLNFTEGGTSDRTYKVLAAKGFLMTQPWDGMENDFTPDKDLVVFNNEQEFEDKSKFYLTHEDERKAIAQNGYETVQKFTREAWAKNMLEKIYGIQN